MEKQMTTADIEVWLSDFQKTVNGLFKSEALQFTTEIWDPDATQQAPSSRKTKLVQKAFFPYLDMELYWHSDNSLKFQVHLKPNQQLKYLNKGSAHTRACLKAIPYGVLNRLAKLTTTTPQNEHQNIDEIYPQHANAL